MATPEQHQAQADHNQAFYETIDSTLFPDWAATVAFYKAVHLVEKLFRQRGQKGGSHMKRNNILKTQYLPIWRHYKALYSFSRLARYWCMEVKPEHVPQIARKLGKVDAEIRNLT
jgi:hypothetical protein